MRAALPIDFPVRPRPVFMHPETRPATDAEAARGRRIVMLLVAITLMSLGDLWMTLTHLTHAGMLEANPLARLVMSYNSPALLAAWKLASVGLAVIILFWARRRAFAELACWGCFLVLVWLTCHWAVYNDHIVHMDEYLPVMAEHAGSKWVSMVDVGW